MDEYADLAWRVIGKPKVEFGPYEQILEWRKEKQCKKFQWYLDEVFPESYVKSMPNDVPHLGPIINKASGDCLDTRNNNYPGSSRIRPHSCDGGESQDFMYFRRVKHIMPLTNDEACLTTDNGVGSTNWCHKGQDE